MAKARSAQDVERDIIEAIASCLRASGKEVPRITLDTIPLEQLQGFDSLCAVEVVVDLEGKLGQKLGDDLFAEGEGKKVKKRSVREIVQTILNNN